MFSKAVRAGVLPGLVVSLVLASSLLVPTNQGAIRLVCSGYGYPNPTCPAPDVTSVHPGAGPTFGGTTVTIMGTDFNNIAPPATKPTVMFDGNAATVLSFTDTKIIAITPAHAAGVVAVTVITAAGSSAVDPGDLYRYVSASYCALFDMSRTPTSWVKGHYQTWYISVFNCGTHSWPATGSARIDISVHFTTKIGTGATTKAYWLGNSYHNLKQNIAPNAYTAFAITLNPSFRGTVKVESEMIILHVLWFGRYLTRPAQEAWVAVVVA